MASPKDLAQLVTDGLGDEDGASLTFHLDLTDTADTQVSRGGGPAARALLRGGYLAHDDKLPLLLAAMERVSTLGKLRKALMEASGVGAAQRTVTPAVAEEKKQQESAPRVQQQPEQQQRSVVELWEKEPPKVHALELAANTRRGKVAQQALAPFLEREPSRKVGYDLRRVAGMTERGAAEMGRGGDEAAAALYREGFLTEPAKIGRFLEAVWAAKSFPQKCEMAAVFVGGQGRLAEMSGLALRGHKVEVEVEEAFAKGREGDMFGVWQLVEVVLACPSVCRIRARSFGTGWVVADGVAMTARHVIKGHLGAEWQAPADGRQFLKLKEQVTLEFNLAERSALRRIAAGVPDGVQEVILPPGTCVVASEALDYCFLLVGGIKQFQDLAEPFRRPLPLASEALQARAAKEHLPLAVLHHPNKDSMSISLQTGKGLFKNDDSKRLLHNAPTQPGSSGAPVLAVDNQGVYVVALHRASAMASDDAYIAEDGAAVGDWHNVSLLLDAIGPVPVANAAAPGCTIM